jgi:hypothetical protein
MMPPPPATSIAIDWSGEAKGAGKRICLAEVVGDDLVRLETGWTIDRLTLSLIHRAESDPSIVVGIDFAFSFPVWFVQQLGGTIESVWLAAERNGEGWLRTHQSPFWGWAGSTRPAADEGRPEFRKTDLALAGVYGRPKSVFQVSGPGTVGTGSIRGMPVLARLRNAGFAIWPFDAPSLPLIVEIYPRALTGRVVKSDPSQRRKYLASKSWPLTAEQRTLAADSEDAFDAALSARAMARNSQRFVSLPAPEADEELEGKIWVP